MTRTIKAPNGRDIWNAVRDEMLDNLYPLPYSTLPPTIYHVYLHPDDFATVEPVVPRIVEQIQRALTSEVERVNGTLQRSSSHVLKRLLDRDEQPPIEIPSSGWTVHIQADRDGELERGKLGIVSTLSLPTTPEYGGTPTTRIVKSVVAGGRRMASTAEVQQAGAGAVQAGAPPVQVVPATHDSSERARLTYEDDQGPHEFVMRKDSLSVGRGGSSAWVDVQVLTSSTKVSREHFRLRRDPVRGFVIQDVSLWGTSVDGAALPPAVKTSEGVVQPGAERELPPRARIGLADALVIDFQVRDA
jgi:hypothetical protein